MDNHAPFLELVSHLRKLLELEGYSDSTIKDMSFILDAFTTYMAENALKEYTPEIGEYLVKYCEQDLHVCESRVVRARRIVRQLNRLSLGLDGRDALSVMLFGAAEQIPLSFPASLENFFPGILPGVKAMEIMKTRSCTRGGSAAGF